MKITAFILLAFCLQVSATTHAQNISLSEHKAPLEKVLNEIKQQSGYLFFYNHDWMKQAQPVDIIVKNASLDEALKACFKNQPYSYEIVNKTIVLKLKEPTVEKKEISVPSKDVTGQVLDNKGVPLVSATVLIKRTKTGTLTDVKGNFTLHDVLSTDVIVVRYIGYKLLEVSVAEKTVFNLVLNETTNSLDQVVVQAYGQTSQRLNTGDITTVSGEVINRQPVMNSLQALEGEVPGLIITPNSGYASSGYHVELRGRSTVNPNFPTDPLYIVDGVPINISADFGNAASTNGILQNGMNSPASGQSELFSINPEDIESVSVLKDADATSIYGSRGANGVIIITTKKGKPGKLKVDANAYEGLSRVTNYYDLMNTQQYISMREEAFKNDNITPTLGNAYDLLQWNTNSYTNWQKALWGNTGRLTDGTLGFSGGDIQTTFRVSGTYHDQTDITTVSGGDKRAAVSFNVSHNSLNQKLKISFTGNYDYTLSNMINIPSSILLPPDAPSVFNNQGQLNYAGWGAANSSASQAFPFASLLSPYTASTRFLTGGFNLGYELLKGLGFNIGISYVTHHNSQFYSNPIASQDLRLNPTAFAQFGINDGATIQTEPTLTYKTTISKGKLDVLAGASDQSESISGSTLSGSGFTNDQLIYAVQNAPTIYGTNGSGQYKYAAVYGRVNYNWADEFLLNLSARRDGSSRFGPGHQYGNFGAVGAAWIFTENRWIKNDLSVLSFGKFRGSYGSTGSDAIGNYQFLTNWSSINDPYQTGGPPSFVAGNLGNPNLVWETDKKLEAALDLGFFKDRLTIEVAWYRNRIENELVDFKLPSITGFTSITANFPAVIQNSGWEGTFNYKIIDSKKVSWAVKCNIGVNQNKLISFPGLSQSPYAPILTVGKSLNIKRLLKYTGIDPQTGQYSFYDKNHNGYVDNGYAYGSTNDLYDYDLSVKADGGIGTDFRYGNFQLNAYFHFRVQTLPAGIYNNTPGTIGNQSVQALNVWKKPGDVALFPQYSTVGNGNDYSFRYASDGVLSNGNYIRLSNLSLSYDLPGIWTKSIGLKNGKFYLRAQNLFIITKYNGIDPEAPGLGIMPPQKILTTGLQFNL